MQSDAINELAAALAKAQAKFTNPPRSHTGKIRGVSKATGKPYEYEYKYADLPDTIDAVRPALNEHGLSIVQLIETDGNGGLLLATQLIHSSGQWIRSEVTIPTGLPSQELGSAVAYRRRYAFSAMVMIAAEDDDDGAGATEREKERGNGPKPKPAGESKPEPEPEAPPVPMEPQLRFEGSIHKLIGEGAAALKAKNPLGDSTAEMKRRVVNILGGHGVERLSEVTKRDEQLAVYREVLAVVEALQADAKAAAEVGL